MKANYKLLRQTLAKATNQAILIEMRILSKEFFNIDTNYRKRYGIIKIDSEKDSKRFWEGMRKLK